MALAKAYPGKNRLFVKDNKEAAIDSRNEKKKLDSFK
jgi:hypothetical protein